MFLNNIWDISTYDLKVKGLKDEGFLTRKKIWSGFNQKYGSATDIKRPEDLDFRKTFDWNCGFNPILNSINLSIITIYNCYLFIFILSIMQFFLVYNDYVSYHPYNYNTFDVNFV